VRRIVVAPDKFKGSLTARAAAQAIARGLVSAWGAEADPVLVPMADGGEGTVDAFVDGGAVRVVHRVAGPLGAPVDASLALQGDTAVVEMALASGLGLLAPGERNPLVTSTRGTGELIRAALDAGAGRVVVAIGGSATNDGGAGMLQALGARMLDAAGRELPPGGAALRALARIDLAALDERLHSVRIDVAADVDNPLCGERGASAGYAEQKGASADDVRQLDAALAHFADVAAETLGRDRRDTPGAGAAGGLGFGLLAFLGATLRPGVELVAELRGLGAALHGAALCVTGEGSIDAQTARGKTVAGVARIARTSGVPVVAFGGRVAREADEMLAAEGALVLPIVDGPMREDAAMRDAAVLLEAAARRLAQTLDIGARV